MERKIPTPPIYSKFHSIPYPNLKPYVFDKNIPTHLNTSPQNHTHEHPFPACPHPPKKKKILTQISKLQPSSKAESPWPQNAKATFLVGLYWKW